MFVLGQGKNRLSVGEAVVLRRRVVMMDEAVLVWQGRKD